MNTDVAKTQMLLQQIRTWNVIDPDVLDAMESLSRADFVPARYAEVAYADAEIPLAHGRKMMAPKIEGRILQALALRHTDDVLEIGTGSAYLTACLARLAGTVVSVDRHQDVLDAARERLEAVGVTNVSLSRMDAPGELPAAQFDAIVVSGSMRRVDERLLEKLKPGGRLFVVIGDSAPMEAMLLRRDRDGGWQETSLFETALDPIDPNTNESAFRF
ncbi:MAG: protein-L-isoaspartate O-methyltransferase [Gammaproteobacteria bacterium]|nr:protein-L-isoaspartate O-methyltransferase [Gammaproteobacteria bacterium]MDH4253247.1 protein-L-isoaspartate O-methyltransferase [Gammaproteobacteria bacterium]MDH5308974.1 protein-L-isoaspartate O-methyltransferase [Gammaproteobacteria bacterium]